MKTITIVADDRVGLLADISYILSKSKINIESVSVDVLAGKAVVVLILTNFDKAKSVLEASGYKVEEANTIMLKLPDQPGELNRITQILAKEGISIHNVRMISKDGKHTVISLAVDKPKRACTLLKDNLLNNESNA
ncbi:MAG: ACT domain-containing protein [Candidatus Bilamarchaeum sp.]|jgi:hypothetical protein